eukprot:54648_1
MAAQTDVELVLTVTALVTICGVLFILLREFHWKKEDMAHPPPTILVLTYAAIILLLTSMISSILNIAKETSFLSDIIDNTVTTIAWCLAQLLAYSIIMLRIRHITSNTPLALQERNYIVFTILVLICVLLCIVWILRSILYYNQYRKDHMARRTLQEVSMFVVVTVEIIDIIVSLFFVSIFVTRFKMLATNAMHTVNQNHAQGIMVKYWMLTFIIIVFAQIMWLLLSLLFVTDYIGGDQAANTIEDIYSIVCPINAIILCICLCLMFQAFDRFYGNQCHFCDTMIRRCFGIKFMEKAQYKAKDTELKQSLLDDNQLF